MLRDITLNDKKEIIRRFVEGDPTKEIAKDFDITENALAKILEENKEIRTELEMLYSNMSVARQNRSIEEFKTETIDYIRNTVQLASTLPAKERLQYLDKISLAINSFDKIQRLNRGEATDRGENINKSLIVNASEIMKQFETDEEKKEWLMRRLTENK